MLSFVATKCILSAANSLLKIMDLFRLSFTMARLVRSVGLIDFIDATEEVLILPPCSALGN
jgi:hypothetical protein